MAGRPDKGTNRADRRGEADADHPAFAGLCFRGAGGRASVALRGDGPSLTVDQVAAASIALISSAS